MDREALKFNRDNAPLQPQTELGKKLFPPDEPKDKDGGARFYRDGIMDTEENPDDDDSEI